MLKLHWILLLLWILDSGASELTCYTCDPTDKEACLDVNKYKVKETTCSTFTKRKSGINKEIANNIINTLDTAIVTDSVFECFSVYYHDGSNSGLTGVHRGCLEKDFRTLSSCELLSEILKNGNITMCQTCTENNCNIHDVNEVNYSPASQTISLILVFLNLIIFCFLNKN